MYCRYCGKKIEDTSTFCPYCGSRLDEEKSTENYSSFRQRNQRKNRSPRRWPWVMVLVLLIAMIVLVLVDLLGNTHYINRFVSSFEAPKAVVMDDGDLYVPDDYSVQTDEDTGISYVNNIIIIFFEPNTPQEQIDSAIEMINGEIVGHIDAIDQYQVRISSHTLEELVDICSELEDIDCVAFATYDEAFAMQPDAIPDDPWAGNWFKSQVWSQEAPDGANWWLEAIDAMDAWDHSADFTHIRIGVIDAGFDTGHEDLKNVIASVSEVNNKDSHGTHVAGIIGAEANNGKGISGIVWDCDLLTSDWELTSFQNWVNDTYDLGWSTTNQILGATVKLVEQGAKVINLSAGQTSSMSGTSRSNDDIYSQGYHASMYLYSLLSRGYDFVIVQSAGNGNKNQVSVDTVNNGLFCSIDTGNCVTGPNVQASDIMNRVIVVGAAQNDLNNHYSQCSFSNAGDRVDICAPGSDVYSTIPGGLFGKYATKSGTSMAAPVVTGVASLVWSVNPQLTGAEVKEIVCANENTRYEVSDNTSNQHPLTNTYRMVNADLAVQAAIATIENEEDEATWKITVVDDEDEPHDQSDAYAAYSALLKEYEDEYEPLYFVGAETEEELPWFIRSRGVCYIRLIDFDNNGTDEFVVVYGEGGADAYGYSMEVWSYDDELKNLYSGHVYHLGVDGMAVCIVDDGNRFLLYCGQWGDNVYTLQSGQLVDIKNDLESIGEWDNSPYVNNEYYSPLTGLNNELTQALTELVEETKATLGYFNNEKMKDTSVALDYDGLYYNDEINELEIASTGENLYSLTIFFYRQMGIMCEGRGIDNGIEFSYDDPDYGYIHGTIIIDGDEAVLNLIEDDFPYPGTGEYIFYSADKHLDYGEFLRDYSTRQLSRIECRLPSVNGNGPAMGEIHIFLYDDSGNLIEDEIKTLMDYNDTEPSDVVHQVYSYDNQNRLIQIERRLDNGFSFVTLQREYDDLGRMTMEAVGEGNLVFSEYTYGNGGDENRILYEDYTVFEPVRYLYSYDNDGHVSQKVTDDYKEWHQYTYDRDGHLNGESIDYQRVNQNGDSETESWSVQYIYVDAYPFVVERREGVEISNSSYGLDFETTLCDYDSVGRTIPILSFYGTSIFDESNVEFDSDGYLSKITWKSNDIGEYNEYWFYWN